MKRFLLFLFFLATPALAQKSNFSTTVITNTGRPVAGARVTLCNHHSNAPNPCTDTSGIQLYSDLEAANPISNPTSTDGYGNAFFFVANGTYDYSIAGNGISTTTYRGVILAGAGTVVSVGGTSPITSTGGTTPVIACATCVTASGGGSISVVASQIGYASAGNTLISSINFQYIPANGGVQITSSNVGPANVTGSGLTMVNSGGGTNVYFIKNSDGSFLIQNDSQLIQGHGLFKWDSSSNLFLQGGSSAPQLTLYTGASISPYGTGSAILEMFNTGTGTHLFSVHGNTGSGDHGAIDLDPFNSLMTIHGDTSGSAAIGVNTAAGSPCNLILSTTSPSAGQSMTSAAPSGGNCQLAWTYTPLVASLSTTAATTDNVTVTGMTASGHCTFSATNASAATNIATTYVSNKTTNQITVTHTATGSMTYDIACTPY